MSNFNGTRIINHHESDLDVSDTSQKEFRANAKTINLEERTSGPRDEEKEEVIHRVSLIVLAIPSAFDRCVLGSCWRGTCIACERQKPVRRQSSGSRATAQSNHEDTRKKCIFVFLGNFERLFRRQRQRQLIGQVSRSSLDEHLGGA